MTVLVALGIALVAFGAVILLWFPYRPGGRIAWQGLEVGSVGAGLPLIALGLVAVALSATGVAPSRLGGASEGGGAALAEADVAECMHSYFDGIDGDRIAVLEAGVVDRTILRPQQPKEGLLGLALNESPGHLGALRVVYLPKSALFRVESVVDEGCQPVDEYENASRPGLDRHILQNYDTMRLRLGGRSYDLRMNAGSDVRVNFLRVEP